MIRRPPRSTQSRSSAASDVYKRQIIIVIQKILQQSSCLLFKMMAMNGRLKRGARRNKNTSKCRWVDRRNETPCLGQNDNSSVHQNLYAIAQRRISFLTSSISV
eukprot:TRINITY_DN9180_c0_g2_i6.p3 TRINITY_DN9180_c0_g2~~TRINITY_DN9180_c0_g2_i6.p3  ORF type:complete len:104 (+),score=18.16 TRINITY_DN9180_c0_g2_i6:21-332(+)